MKNIIQKVSINQFNIIKPNNKYINNIFDINNKSKIKKNKITNLNDNIKNNIKFVDKINDNNKSFCSLNKSKFNIYFIENSKKLNQIKILQKSLSTIFKNKKKFDEQCDFNKKNFENLFEEFKKNIEIKPLIIHINNKHKKISNLTTNKFIIKSNSSTNFNSINNTNLNSSNLNYYLNNNKIKNNEINKYNNLKNTNLPFIYNKMKHIYNNNINNNNNLILNDVYKHRYDKQNINISQIIINYNRNKNRNFKGYKIKPYFLKISPFL